MSFSSIKDSTENSGASTITKNTERIFAKIVTVQRIKPRFKEILTVLGGPEEVPFKVWKDVLRSKSDFFRAACSERWPEGREGVVRLPEQSAAAFKIYVKWAYFGYIALDIALDMEGNYWDGPTPSDQDLQFELYFLGSHLQDSAFCKGMAEDNVAWKYYKDWRGHF